MIGPQIIIGLGFLISVALGVIASRIMLQKSNRD